MRWREEGGSISINYSISIQLSPLNPKGEDGVSVANLSEDSSKLVVSPYLQNIFNLDWQRGIKSLAPRLSLCLPVIGHATHLLKGKVHDRS